MDAQKKNNNGELTKKTGEPNSNTKLRNDTEVQFQILAWKKKVLKKIINKQIPLRYKSTTKLQTKVQRTNFKFKIKI